MTDDEFIAAFENCTLGKQDFHHADHVRMAFLYLERFSVLKALRRFSEALKQFATASGKPNLYHETITWAFLLLIRERITRWSQQNGRMPDWHAFTLDNADLLNWKANILQQYYREETLASDFARKVFVLPDRALAPH